MQEFADTVHGQRRACCAKEALKRHFFFTCRDYKGHPHLRLRTLLQAFSQRTTLLFAAELVHQQPVYDHTTPGYAAAESKRLPLEMSNIQVQREKEKRKKKRKKKQARSAAAT